ncbi:hypothetical protein ABZ907_39020 [Nonomuraea wenchangensis]
MTDDHTELKRLRDYAEKVLARLREQPPTTQAHVRVARQEAERLAAELAERTEERMTFAFVGDSNAGKSRLMSALLRMPELLKVSGAPATGNVTAVRVLPDPRGDAPELAGSWISFLSLNAVAECAGFIMSRLHAVVAECRLPYPVGMLRGYNPVVDGWDRLEEFARPLWHDAQANAEVRALAYELLRLRDAVARGGRLLPATDPGQHLAVDAALLHQAIEIGGSRTIPEEFPERHFIAPLPADAELTAQALREVFPLVRRVTYEVRMPDRLWDLSAVGDPRGVELCDHPGLNTLGGARDEYLSQRELRRVTSIAVVLNARQSETVGPARLRGLLEGGRWSREELAHSLLVVANHFDAITPPVPGAAVTLGALRGLSEELASLLRAAGELSGGRADTTTLTSAVFGRDREVRERARGWEAVTAALRAHAAGEAHTPEHRLAAALAAYAADGGIESLRRRITVHLREHGVRILLGECRAVQRDLRDRLERLQRLESGGPAADGDDQRVAHAARALSQAALAMRERISRLSGLGALTLPDGRAVLDHVRRAVIGDVYLWNCWTETMRRSVRGTIEPRAVQHRSVFPGPTPARTDDGAADTTESLREPYMRALAEAHHEAFDLLSAALDRWMDDCEQAVAAARELLDDPRTSALLEERLALLDPADGGGRRMLLLRYLTRPRDWVPEVLRTSIHSAGGADLTVDEHLFPLADHHALPWHAAMGRHAEARERTVARRHQSRLFQLRRDLANGMAYTVQSRLARVVADLHGRLTEAMQELERELPTPGDLGRTRRPRPGPDLPGQGYDDLL